MVVIGDLIHACSYCLQCKNEYAFLFATSQLIVLDSLSHFVRFFFHDIAIKEKCFGHIVDAHQGYIYKSYQNVTDRNRDTQDMRLYTSVDDGCADCWRHASRACVWGNTMALNSLEFRQADPVEFGELVASRGLNLEEEFR